MASFGAEPARIAFELPARPAEISLKSFSEQSGLEVLFATETTANVTTNSIKGEFTPKEAIDRMLEGTNLVAEQDPRTGAMKVSRAPSPNGSGAAPVVTGSDRPTEQNETIKLSPFEVQADSDTSYGALNSNSITSFNTQLNKMPMTADIFTDAFMKDLGGGSDSVETMVEMYSPGAGIGNVNGTDPNANQPGDRVAAPAIALRGLSGTRQQRDGFLPLLNGAGTGFTPTFDTERVEVIEGPQSLLYGIGGGGGVINIVSKQARLGAPTFGSASLRVDQYGNRTGKFDFGASTDRLAVRVATIDGSTEGRRVNIGGPLSGYYAQVAFKPFSNTTIRVAGEQTTYLRDNAQSFALTAASTSNDARNGDNLHYLLATNQIGSAANGAPSGAGPINNGNVTWDNVDSFAGWQNSELIVFEWEELTADTQWTSWLSSQVKLAMVHGTNAIVSEGLNFYAPNAAANPVPGQWQLQETSGTPGVDSYIVSRSKAIQASVLATNDLFGGRAHSQTILGFSNTELISHRLDYAYYLADSSWNPVLTPGVTANLGRTVAPKLFWPTNPPTKYPGFFPGTPRITYAGSNYLLMLSNPIDPSKISAANPLGVATIGGANYTYVQPEYSAPYGLNTTEWMDGKLTTLIGFRYDRAFNQVENQSGNTQSEFLHKPSFDAGANYAVREWLRPYFSVSDSYDPLSGVSSDPMGVETVPAQAIGEEVGVKLQNAAGTISGSLAIYHTNSKNEQFTVSTTLENDINPTGLNGRFGTPSNIINVARTSQGLQALVTAAPTPNWRLRLGASLIRGEIGTGTSYGQLYNDQFNENSSGQVTYADGSLVYVAPTFNSKTPAYTAANAPAGSVPLTVAAMSSPSSVYYANPAPITGQISAGAVVHTVLQTVDPTHGAIVTGKNGLPISMLQIDPGPSGITIPGTIVTTTAGDVTTGYPEFSVTLTSLYTVPSGVAKGLQLGGTFLGAWRTSSYYFYSNGVTPGATRMLFRDPTTIQFDPMVGYIRKFGRYTYRAQLNISNLFNHYEVVLRPNSLTGFNTPSGINAAFWQQPRSWLLTNTLDF